MFPHAASLLPALLLLAHMPVHALPVPTPAALTPTAPPSRPTDAPALAQRDLFSDISADISGLASFLSSLFVIPNPKNSAGTKTATFTGTYTGTKTSTVTVTYTYTGAPGSTAHPTNPKASTTSSTPVSSSTSKAATTSKATTTTTTLRTITSPKASTTTTTKAPTTKASTTTKTSTTSAVATSATYWRQKSTFTSLAEFEEDLGISRYVWGGNNTAVNSTGVAKSAWNSEAYVSLAESDPTALNSSAVQIVYPKGSRTPGVSPVGGVGFYTDQLNITQSTNVTLEYKVFFPENFDFVKGGKLPGLYGGKTGCSGGSDAENCFSTRFMWRKGGAGELYLYAPRAKQTSETCSLPPLSYCNSVDGMSLGRGSWTFKTGQWNTIRQDIWLNTPGTADGGFNIFFNGELVLHSSTVYYRNEVTTTSKVASGSGSNMTLIDYDNLPDNITIPNGGLTQVPEGYNVTTKIASSTEDDPYNRLKKRATSKVGFLGVMFDTFFGGSDSTWASPREQYSYFESLQLYNN